MEAGSTADEVVVRGSHHWRPDSHSSMVLARFVIHVGPDPQRSRVVGAHIVTCHKLRAKLIVVVLGSSTESRISPSNGGIVDLSTPVANLVSLMEVSVQNTSMDLDFLARADLSLDLGGCNLVVTSVKLVKLLINVLRHSDCLELTRL